MSLGHGHRNSFSVEGFLSLVCILASLGLGWSPSRRGVHFLFCSSTEREDDDTFEKSIEESLDAGRGPTGGFVFLGVDANCDVDNVQDQRGSLVRDWCCYQGLCHLFQSKWTLSWLSPDGFLRKKKVDFVFTNQTCASVAVSEDVHLRSDHKPLCVSLRRVDGVMLEFARKKRSLAGWVPASLSQQHEFQNSIARHVVLGSTIGHIQQVLESAMLHVNNERDPRDCELLTDAERRLDAAREQLRHGLSSESARNLSVSSLGKMSSP